MNPLVIVSYYDRRPDDNLKSLLASMARHSPGAAFDLNIVVNATSERRLDLAPHPFKIEVSYRPNIGMNIGAWDYGWRASPDRPAYLFLQDECTVVREGWLRALVDQARTPGNGLVGESLNPSWSHSWRRLAALHAGGRMPEHFIDGEPADRVDVYLHHLARWGIDPGEGGAHLRSLIWAASGEALTAINGFPHGANYGECIAAEIGVSRSCVARGFAIRQIHDIPFYYIRHSEWNQDFPGEAFNHSKKPINSQPQAGSIRGDRDREAFELDLTLPSEGVDQMLRISALKRKLEDREQRILELERQLRKSGIQIR